MEEKSSCFFRHRGKQRWPYFAAHLLKMGVGRAEFEIMRLKPSADTRLAVTSVTALRGRSVCHRCCRTHEALWTQGCTPLSGVWHISHRELTPGGRLTCVQGRQWFEGWTPFPALTRSSKECRMGSELCGRGSPPAWREWRQWSA